MRQIEEILSRGPLPKNVERQQAAVTQSETEEESKEPSTHVDSTDAQLNYQSIS